MKRFLRLSLVALLLAGAVRAEPVGNSTCDGGTGTLSADIFTAYTGDTSRNGFSLDGGSALADGGSLLSAKQQAMVCSQVYNYAQYLGVSDAGASSSQTYDIDFTGLATATLPTNSSVTIGGKPWTTVDYDPSTANTTFQITNGTGLTITSTNTTSAAAYIHANLQDLIPGAIPYVNVTDMEVWFYAVISPFGTNGSSGRAWLGIQSTDQAANIFRSVIGRAAAVGSSPFNADAAYGGGDNENSFAGNGTLTDNVYVVRMSSDGYIANFFTGVYGSTWPDASALHYRASVKMQNSNIVIFEGASPSSQFPLIGTTGPVMEVLTFSSPATTMTIKRMLVIAK